MSTLWHVYPCSDPACEFCEHQAEERAETEPSYDDPGGQDQYERHLDRMGGSL